MGPHAAGPPVKSVQFRPLPGLRATGAALLRNGGLQDDLYQVYGGLGSGRMVIVGPAGSGKSGAAVLLIRTALEKRKNLPGKERSAVPVPVPVMFTLHGWDPDKPVREWLVERLRQTYPLFRGKGGTAQAAALVDGHRIAVILDGLDEIPEHMRPVALKALSRDADFRVVVLGRGDETAAAAGQEILVRAVALELQDVAPQVAAKYLESVQRHPPPGRVA
jgi:hypothetical protein